MTTKVGQWDYNSIMSVIQSGSAQEAPIATIKTTIKDPWFKDKATKF